MGIWGWMSPAELTWLGLQASRMRSVAEIGCLHGRSAFALLTACPGPVYCIDPWNDVHDASYPSFMSNCGHFENLVAVRGYSPAAIYTDNLPAVDMVFIDGSHDYDSVIADISHWTPKARRLVCGHDYINQPDAAFPGVAQAVNDYFADGVRVAPDTAIWYVRL